MRKGFGKQKKQKRHSAELRNEPKTRPVTALNEQPGKQLRKPREKKKQNVIVNFARKPKKGLWLNLKFWPNGESKKSAHLPGSGNNKRLKNENANSEPSKNNWKRKKRPVFFRSLQNKRPKKRRTHASRPKRRQSVLPEKRKNAKLRKRRSAKFRRRRNASLVKRRNALLVRRRSALHGKSKSALPERRRSDGFEKKENNKD
mmetsp:Transcript_136630/g.272510  ORF Transcript_136630/g.272510 Transcript_136630/m.272510 type:complete len:202 (-) Transcript_136630:3266-3871(-)